MYIWKKGLWECLQTNLLALAGLQIKKGRGISRTHNFFPSHMSSIAHSLRPHCRKVLRTRLNSSQSEEWPLFYWAGLWMCSLHTAGSHLREIPYCTTTQNTCKKAHIPQFKGIYFRAFHHIPQYLFSLLHNPPAPHFSDGAAVLQHKAACMKLHWTDIS